MNVNMMSSTIKRKKKKKMQQIWSQSIHTVNFMANIQFTYFASLTELSLKLV